MVQFVKLNVGGHPYHVSRALLEMHPQSMLARIVTSAEESGTHNDPDSDIFVDGDGVSFRYVLNYLRHGRVFLPFTEPKESFMNELSYYGIAGKPDEIFTVGQQPQQPIEETNGVEKAPRVEFAPPRGFKAYPYTSFSPHHPSDLCHTYAHGSSGCCASHSAPSCKGASRCTCCHGNCSSCRTSHHSY